MKSHRNTPRTARALLACLGLASLLPATGCAQDAASAPAANAAASAPADWRTSAQKILRAARAVPQPPGIEELRSVDIGGIKQWISVRGRDRRNPILLFIHGGPASTEMP
jgi:hypothetical protein